MFCNICIGVCKLSCQFIHFKALYTPLKYFLLLPLRLSNVHLTTSKLFLRPSHNPLEDLLGPLRPSRARPTDRPMNRWTNDWMDRWIDRWIDERTDRYSLSPTGHWLLRGRWSKAWDGGRKPRKGSFLHSKEWEKRGFASDRRQWKGDTESESGEETLKRWGMVLRQRYHSGNVCDKNRALFPE